MTKIKKNQIKFKKNLDPRIKKLVIEILKVEPQRRPTCDQILQKKELVDIVKEYSLDRHLKDFSEDSFQFHLT